MEPQTMQQPTTPLPADKPNTAKIAGIAVLVLAIVGAIVGGVILTQHEADNQASAATAPSAQVQLTANGQLSPETIQVKKGQSVTWTNTGSGLHRIAPAEGAGGSTAPGFGSTPLEEDSTYTYTFEQTGTYSYYDALSSGHQAGTVIVRE